MEGGNGMIYVDRGDPANFDFDANDFVTDGINWYELDLSSIVPSNAKRVEFNMIINHTVADKDFQFRQKGNVNTKNRCFRYLQVANQAMGWEGAVPIGSDGIIEYKASGGIWTEAFFVVRGWWI